MRRHKLLILSSIIFCSVAAYSDQTAQIDSLFANLFGKKSPGVAVLVARDGKVLFKKGYGFADVSRNVSINPDTTVFDLASDSKQFTAMGILILQERRKLSI